MPRQPAKGRGAGKLAPGSAKHGLANQGSGWISRSNGTVEEFLQFYSERTQEAARRLLNDLRMDVHWGSKFNFDDFEEATHIFELALSRAAWDQLSKREQHEWIDQFDKTIAKLLSLLGTAPQPPERWGFPVRDVVLAEAAQRMGIVLPEASEEFGLFRAGIRLERAVDSIEWTIVHSLKHFQRQQHTSAEVGQPLKKPRDAKASRAYFLNRLQECRPDITAEVVAIVASVMFEEEEVHERKVREHRPDGLSRKRRNPS